MSNEQSETTNPFPYPFLAHYTVLPPNLIAKYNTQQQDVSNNGIMKAFVGLLGGGVLGGLIGGVLGAYDTTDFPKFTGTLKQRLKQNAAMTWSKAKIKGASWGRNFGLVGALYSGTEATVQKARGTHDMFNGMYAGCITGGVMAYSGAMVAGCASFAAFSAFIEAFQDKKDAEEMMMDRTATGLPDPLRRDYHYDINFI